ncbi:LD-carboxypeptidase [Flavobacterium sp. Sd200]|uniref:S66 peptidase family protein n=1 Tax=Flavobacterium sp. Sd200 TaxID=2692211 RepID=UPI00136F5155|nr:LD-carboxypeptidase [Flavobacterium sp. Sd200]MXN89978.1 LD-carboxypeptidase [Flavobacterium sp. Sd200]
MITPPYLKPNDKVAVVSTAKRTEPEEIEEAIATLKKWDLQPVIGNHAFSTDGFLAGTDEERAADLQKMLDDSSIKAVFFTKGGYGTLRIIDDIDFTAFKQKPKWLIGYSDITLLHSHIHNFGIQSLHAVMLQGYAKSTPDSIGGISKAIFGESLSYDFKAHEHNRSANQSVSGTLVGGNLSMLYATIGSGSEIDTDGKILFIEDIDEYLYHYDRMLISLKRAGKLTNLKALVVGALIDIKESTIPFGRDAYQITLEQTAQFGYPVYFGFPAGHTPDNRALIMGSYVSVSQTGSTVTLAFKD